MINNVKLDPIANKGMVFLKTVTVFFNTQMNIAVQAFDS